MSFFRPKDNDARRRSQDGLTGHMLIAMPNMHDEKFNKAVIFVVSHNSTGAMGLLVNKPVSNITFSDLLRQLAIQTRGARHQLVQFGGPVETGRGFVLHSSEYASGQATVDVARTGVRLTTTVDVLRAIAEGNGPQKSMVALGYAGWGSGQLERELQKNAWIFTRPDDFLLYNSDCDSKWEYAIRTLGFTPSQLTSSGGRA